MDVETLGRSGWSRPEPDSVIGFVVLFLLFTLAGYAIHAHIRSGRLSQRATGIVGVCFVVAILYGFATGLWLLDRFGIADPYASEPWPPTSTATTDRSDRSDRIMLPNGAEMEPTFTIERPSLEPTRAAGG